METNNDIRPFQPVHPGAILKEELKARGIRQNVFAAAIGMQPTHLNALLQGGRNITAQLALRLEAALKIPAVTWMNLQEKYNLDRIRTSELVDGYYPHIPDQFALADGSSDNSDPLALYRKGYAAGQADLLEMIIGNLIMQGYSREEALSLIVAEKIEKTKTQKKERMEASDRFGELLDELRADIQRRGVPEMSLDEINAIIKETREQMRKEGKR
jgi:addiction module HigA family antidote